jgi:hypothetical protein
VSLSCSLALVLATVQVPTPDPRDIPEPLREECKQRQHRDFAEIQQDLQEIRKLRYFANEMLRNSTAEPSVNDDTRRLVSRCRELEAKLIDGRRKLLRAWLY